MNVVELFSGTGILSERARAWGHRTVTVDLEADADIREDILTVTPERLLERLDGGPVHMLWASPPCTGFSVMSIGRYWKIERGVPVPQHDTPRLGLRLLEHTLALIEALRPRVFFIENPRGMMRKMPHVQRLNRVTVTYCQYGERRMKPTDIWTNARFWYPRPACRKGDPCHEPAPRGSRTGTQGIEGARLRARLPTELCDEVIAATEREIDPWRRTR